MQPVYMFQNIPVPQRPRTYLVRFIVFSAIAMIVPQALSILLGMTGSFINGITNGIATILGPVLKPAFWLGGAYTAGQQASAAPFLDVLFMLIYLRGLAFFVPMFAAVRLSLPEDAITTARYNFYFMAAVILALFAQVVRLVPCAAGPTTWFKMAIVLGCIAGAITLVALAFVVWRERLSSLPRPSHLKVVASNAEARSGSSSSAAIISAPDLRLYVAMAAAFIQTCGAKGRPPSVDELAAALRPAVSGAAPDLGSLATRALAIFNAGQLENLPGKAAAIALYKKPDGSRMDAIARELRSKLAH